MNWDDSIFIFGDISDTIQDMCIRAKKSFIRYLTDVNYKANTRASFNAKLVNSTKSNMLNLQSLMVISKLHSLEPAGSLGIIAVNFSGLGLRFLKIWAWGTRGLNSESLVTIL